jgi:hypothetical protein
MAKQHTVFVGVMNSDMIEPVIQNLNRTKYQAYIGNNVKSFSELVNNCIKECTTEIFIFCSHRVSPTDNDIDRLISLLNAGYGYVGLYRFACFGIHMDIINKIGYLDENFLKGGFEDDDYKIRLQYRNIAFYEDHSLIYRASPSLWTTDEIYIINEKRIHDKYKLDHHNKTIILPETEEYIHPIDTSKYLPFNKSYIIPSCTFYSRYNIDKYRFIVNNNISHSNYRYSKYKKAWNVNADNGFIGNQFICSNSSSGYHGILKQWWEEYNTGLDVLLISENNKVKQEFLDVYPKWNITTIGLNEDDIDINVDLCLFENPIENKYDLIINQATLEHLYNPFQAIYNLMSVLKPNGIIVSHSHPPGFGYHQYPRDYFRFMIDWWIDLQKYIKKIELLEVYMYNNKHVFTMYRKI